MFDSDSRYALLCTSTAQDRGGRDIALADRRFLPDPADIQVTSVTTTGVGERLDQVAARTLGRSDQWYRLAETLRTLEPVEAERERALKVPLLGVE